MGRHTKRGRELPHIRDQGQWPRVPGCDGAGIAERSYPKSEARGGGLKEQPHARGQGGDWEEQPHTQRVVAVRVQEGLESHPTLKVRKGDGRRYPSSKVRSSSCALLEQP